jgi:hypothetical protein
MKSGGRGEARSQSRRDEEAWSHDKRLKTILAETDLDIAKD